MKLSEDFTTRSKIADVGRWYVTQFVKEISQSLPTGCIILDAGAGECAYKSYFAHCRYIGVDLAVGEVMWNYGNLDCISRLDQLPFSDHSFDTVLTTQTLEHLQWPAESLCELNRVLKSNGKLFLTAPMAHAEHQQPHDFFRYTSYGLRVLCERAGFTEIEVKPFGGIFTRWAYELPLVLSLFPSSGIFERRLTLSGLALLPLKLLICVWIRMIQIGLLYLDSFDKHKGFPFGWSLVAIKP